MKQDPNTSTVALNPRRIAIAAGLALSLIAWAGASGCIIKRTVKTRIPPKILRAKSASFNELLDIVNRGDAINTLTSNDIRVTFVLEKKDEIALEKKDESALEKYPRAPGYILLRRPDSLFMVIQNPWTRSSIFKLLSVGDEFRLFRIWGSEKFYVGKNSAKELATEDLPNSSVYTIRAPHIFEAVFPPKLSFDSPDMRISETEETGADAKYYLLSVFREGNSRRIYAIRRIWIERSAMQIARQQTFLEEGQIESDILYSGSIQSDGFYFPSKIHIDRPIDGYTLDMEFKDWRVNPDLEDDAFTLTPPEGVPVQYLKEKGRDGAS